MHPLSALPHWPYPARSEGSGGDSFAAVRGGCVLMVEDEPEIARMVQHVFRGAGLAMTAVASGCEAVRLLERNAQAYSLLFADYLLPDIDGLDLCRHLRGIVPGLPVLLASGSERSDACLQLKLGGPTVFVRKPYLPNQLIRHARNLMMRSLQVA
jgi:CheY-like chemotaxis protein